MEDERLGKVKLENPCPKNNENTSSNNSNNNTNTNNNNNNNNKEQDRFLPIANVGRIMKKVIPANGKISKDAKETVQECVSEFISFITGEASDKCQQEKRKTINGDDIIWAITTLGFEEYIDPLQKYLAKYRELEDNKGNNNGPKQQQQQQQQQHNTTNNLPYENVYSSSAASIISQSYGLPFSPSSIQTQIHPQESIDSVGHW